MKRAFDATLERFFPVGSCPDKHNVEQQMKRFAAGLLTDKMVDARFIIFDVQEESDDQFDTLRVKAVAVAEAAGIAGEARERELERRLELLEDARARLYAYISAEGPQISKPDLYGIVDRCFQALAKELRP